MSQALKESDPSPMKLEILGVEDWPLVINAVGQMETRTTVTETSYIAEGAAEITAEDGAVTAVGAGDLLTLLPDGQFRWTITKEIHRHCHDLADG